MSKLKCYVKKDEDGELHAYTKGHEIHPRQTTNKPTWVDGWIKGIKWEGIDYANEAHKQHIRVNMVLFARQEIAAERRNRPQLVEEMEREWNEAYPDLPWNTVL